MASLVLNQPLDNFQDQNIEERPQGPQNRPESVPGGLSSISSIGDKVGSFQALGDTIALNLHDETYQTLLGYPACTKSNDLEKSILHDDKHSILFLKNSGLLDSEAPDLALGVDVPDLALEISFPGNGPWGEDCGDKLLLKCHACGTIFQGTHWCMGRECPVCESKWASKESRIASDRLWIFKSTSFVDNKLISLIPPRKGRIIHYCFSFNLLQPGDLTNKILNHLRELVIILAKLHGLIGGLHVLHHERRGNLTDDGEGIHFHGVGFAPGNIKHGHEEIEIKNKKGELEVVDIDGPYVNFIHFPDPSMKKKNKGKYSGFRRVRSVKKCINYVLSHCAIIKGKHSLTWWGDLSYRKFRQSDVRDFLIHENNPGYGILPCPVCGIRVINEIYHDHCHYYSENPIKIRSVKAIRKVYIPIALALDDLIEDYEGNDEFLEKKYSTPEHIQKEKEWYLNHDMEEINIMTGKVSFSHPPNENPPWPKYWENVDKTCDNCRRFPCEKGGILNRNDNCFYPSEFIWKHDHLHNLSFIPGFKDSPRLDQWKEQTNSTEYYLYTNYNVLIPKKIQKRLPQGWNILQMGILPNGGRL